MAGGSNIGPCLGTRYCTTATHSDHRKYLVWIVGRWFVHQHSATRRHTILHNFLSQKKWEQNVKEKEKYPKNNVKNYISRILVSLDIYFWICYARNRNQIPDRIAESCARLRVVFARSQDWNQYVVIMDFSLVFQGSNIEFPMTNNNIKITKNENVSFSRN